MTGPGHVPGAGYVNPLTVISIVEAVQVHKSNVFIHTAAWLRDPAVVAVFGRL